LKVLTGICDGLYVVGINTGWIKGYDEAMATLSLNNYPIALVFRRGGKSMLMKAAGSVANGSKVFVKSVANQLGFKKESLLTTPVVRKLANTKTTVRKEYNEAVEKATKGSKGEPLVSGDVTKMSTRKWLPAECGPSEFDVSFDEGELGCRLEERVALTTDSVVTAVASDGQAAAKGLRIGCTVVGVSGELFLSHAHTIATLRHSKRPVLVRFKRPPGF
jgi:S1-C subfamily serine protease